MFCLVEMHGGIPNFKMQNATTTLFQICSFNKNDPLSINASKHKKSRIFMVENSGFFYA